MLRRVKAAIVESLTQQSEHTRQMRVEEIYLSAIRSALTAGSAHLSDRKTLQEPSGSLDPLEWGWMSSPGPDMSVVWRPQGALIGWVDSDSGAVYLHPESAYETAVAHSKRLQVLGPDETKKYDYVVRLDTPWGTTQEEAVKNVQISIAFTDTAGVQWTRRVTEQPEQVLDSNAATDSGG